MQNPLFRAFEKSLKTELEKALTDSPPADADLGTVALALSYAEMIDADPSKLPKLGPHLLSALAELKMTPRARTGVPLGRPPKTDDRNADGPAATVSPLDKLREQRAQQRAVR
jgi:hypothetical protein